MPRSTPAVAVPVFAGVNPNPSAPDATGDIVDPGTTLVVVNGSGASINVTVDVTLVDELGRALADIVVAVPAAGTRVIKIPNKRVAGQASDATVGPNRVLVNYSAVTSVTRYVLPA